MSPTQTGPLADVHAYLKSKDKDFTADLPTFEKDIQDDGVRQQVYEYLKGQDKEFTASFDEFSTDLGVKKKSGTSDGGTPSSTSSPTTPTPVDLPADTVAPGTQPGDTSFGLPQATELGYHLPGAPAPEAEQVPQLESVVPFAPGTEVNPLAANLPTIGTEAEPIDPRAPAVEEQDYLNQLPAFTGGPVADDGKERVAIPNDYSGAVPAGSYQLHLNGPGDLTQYFDRDLSKLVDGKEQSAWEAASTNFGNQLVNMAKGGADYLAAADRRLRATGVGQAADKLGAAIGLNGDPSRGVPFQEAADNLESMKGKVAPFHERSTFRFANPGTWPMATSNAAALAAPMVLSALLPESKIAGIAQKILAAGFDGQMLEASVERAKQAGLTGVAADNYVLADGAATMLVFKLGSAGLNATGQRILQAKFGQTIATALKDRTTQLTQAELNTLLTQAAQKLAPVLKKSGVGAASGGVLFAANEAKTIAGEQLTNATLGQNAFPTQTFAQIAGRIGTAAGEGAAVMGLQGAAEGVGSALYEGGATIIRPATADEQAPLDTNTDYYVTGDSSTTQEGSLSDARIIGPGATPGTVRVRGLDMEGKEAEHDIEQQRLAPQAELEAMANEEDAQQAEQPAAEAQPEAPVESAPAGTPTPFPTDRAAAMERLARMQQRLADAKGIAPSTPDASSSANIPVPAEAAASSPASPEPSEVEPPTPTASAPDAASRPLPAAEPHPDHVKPLTTKQQKTNAALDALDRFNALNKTEQKSENGKARRKELIQLAGKAGLKVKDLPTGKAAFDGPRVTRSNEYTATTPAANHVSLESRPAEAKPFMEAVLKGAENNPTEIQGLGIKMRGKELSGRELADAVKDIRAGKNTLRAQLVLDALENAHRQGYLEKSTGTGLATRKFTVPVEDYLGGKPAEQGKPADLTDDELDAIYDSDPKAKQAVDDYAFSDGTIDYARLANDERGLPFLFDVSDETATKLATIARERAQQQPPQSPDSNDRQFRENDNITPVKTGIDAGSSPQSTAGVDGPAPASEPAAEVALNGEAGPFTYHTYNRPNTQLPNSIDGQKPTFTGRDTFTVERALSKATIDSLELDPITQAESLVGLSFEDEAGYPRRFGEIKKSNGRSFIDVEKLDPDNGEVYETEQMPLAEALNIAPANPRLTDSDAPQSALTPTLAEQNVAAKQEFADALAEFRAARKKKSGVLQSSVLGVPAFSAEEAAALTKMAKAAVKLGAVKTKQIIARLRAQGLSDDDATAEQLTAFVKDFRKSEGLTSDKLKAGTPDATTATGERAHAKRYDQATQDALPASAKNYVPTKAQIAASESPADFIKRAGLDAAYQDALTPPADREPVLHDNLIREVGNRYADERDAALKAGNAEAANVANGRYLEMVGSLSIRGTEAAKVLAARVGSRGTIGQLVDAENPAETGRAVVDAALGKAAETNAQQAKEAQADATDITTQAKTKRKAKMSEVLDTATVRAAVEKAAGSTTPPTEAAPADKTGYGESNKFFTKKKVADWRKQLKSMAFSAPLPAEAILLGAYHLEASTRKFTDWSAKMIREAGVRIRPRLSELYELSKAELLKKDPAASGFNTPDEVATIVGLQAVPGGVRDGIKELGKRITDIAKQHADDIETDRRTLTDKFIQDAGLSGPAAKAVADAIEKEWNRRVEKAAWQSLRGRFQPKRSRAKVDALTRLTNDLNAAANLPAGTMRSPVAQLLEQLRGGNISVSAAEAQHIEQLKDDYVKVAQKTTQQIAGRDVATKNTAAVQAAAVKLLTAIGKLKGVQENNFSREVGALFYASLLSSPNTHLANAYLNAVATGHEVGLISTLHTFADTGSIRFAGQVIGALVPGYKQGAADLVQTVRTGIDVKSKVGNSLTDKDYETDPLEERSFGRRLAIRGLQKVGLGKNLTAPEQSSLTYVKRALGGSDAFFQGGLAESRAKEIAIKMAAMEVRQRKASGTAMTRQQVRDYVGNRVDDILFSTPQAIADITAIVDAEGLKGGSVAEWSARQARIGDLLNQARASEHPELVADSKEFAARHAGNSEYEGHLGRFAKNIAETFGGVPVVGKIIVPFSRVTSNFQNRYAEWAGLGYYRAIRGGAGKSIFGSADAKSKPFERDYTPEEQEKAFLRSTIGTVSAMTAYALAKAGYIYITGLPTGNKDEDQQHPAQAVGFTDKAPEALRGLSITYKGLPEEIALTTIAGTMTWAKKKELAGDDPEVSQRMMMAGVIGAAATMNLGPSNGAGDFLGAVSGVTQNPERTKRAILKLPRTALKAVVQPAGVAYALQLFSKATDASLPAKQSNEAFEQLKLDLFGDVPYWRGGAEDALDLWGDPMKVETNRFYGLAPTSNDPNKTAIKRRLVTLEALPDEPRITDSNLRLYDVNTGKGTSPLTQKEFHDYMEARGRSLWRSIQQDKQEMDLLLKGDPTEAADEFKALVKDANEDAKDLILQQRIKAGADLQFGKARP